MMNLLKYQWFLTPLTSKSLKSVQNDLETSLMWKKLRCSEFEAAESGLPLSAYQALQFLKFYSDDVFACVPMTYFFCFFLFFSF
jgi:hypothetical protein